MSRNSINKESLPKHVAIIMDGNRRWAKEKGLPFFEGHIRGEEKIESIVDRSIELGISYITFWAFSTENWQRSKKEVEFLLALYRNNLNKKIGNFHKKNVKINVLGDLSMFPDDIQRLTYDWINKTKVNEKITVNLALSYGGRDEILRAISKLYTNLQPKTYNLKPTSKEFEKHLDTAGQPDPDLLVRTGGEYRLSGFMLWQIAYSELYFSKTLWPDFTPREFDKAIIEYQKRQRRFGK